MTLKLKALGLGLFSVIALGSVAAVSAPATTGGHFVSDSPSGQTTVVGSENATHFGEMSLHGLEGGMICDESVAHATVVGNTATEVLGTATVAKCHTTGGNPGEITVHTNGCQGRATVAPIEVTSEQTGDLVCPAEKAVVITHPNCTITVPPQNNVGSGTYTTDIDSNGKHIITGIANGQFKVEYHGGICIFTGTNHTATATGSATVRGFDAVMGSQVNITAT